MHQDFTGTFQNVLGGSRGYLRHLRGSQFCFRGYLDDQHDSGAFQGDLLDTWAFKGVSGVYGRSLEHLRRSEGRFKRLQRAPKGLRGISEGYPDNSGAFQVVS